MSVAVDEEAAGRAQLRVSTVLRGKYRLDRVLGVGGMASVYAATHLRNANQVAVKILHRELSIDAVLRGRFLREGYAANSVGHSGTIRVLDDDTAEDGSIFIVMDLLDGETLDARWERSGRRLGVREVVTLMSELLDVLGAAHAKGIVHRDLKPENLFVTRDGKLKVLDFGIARIREASPSTTRAGAVFGTPAFMPPEQALGRTSEVDERSDLWAVGATAFTLLAGRFVHEGRTPEEMLVLSATRPAPPLLNIIEDVPEMVAQVIDRALAFEKTDRWQSARTMRDALLDADKLVRSSDQVGQPYVDEDEKTKLALAPEMTLRGQTPLPFASEPEDGTLELSTLPAASTIAGVEPQSDARGRRRFPVISVALGGLGVGVFVALLAILAAGAKRSASPEPPSTNPAAIPSGGAAAQATVSEPPSVAVETLPISPPTVEIATALAPFSVAVPKTVLPAMTVRSVPTLAGRRAAAPPPLTSTKTPDPLAP